MAFFVYHEASPAGKCRQIATRTPRRSPKNDKWLKKLAGKCGRSRLP